MEGDDALAVTVFLFEAGDGRTREERLKAAARFAGYGAPQSGNEEELWRIAREERGKPYFPGQPRLHFSISHSGELWVCALSGRPLGVDIQKHTTKRGESAGQAAARLSGLAERFFHPGEAAWVRENPGERFFRIWAAKESYVKYTGEGIGGSFGTFCLVPDGGEGHSWKAENVWFYGEELPDGYSLCVCCGEDKMSVQIVYYDEKTDNFQNKRNKTGR